eukprot:2133176-Alexandrium_andersonii.AAC.1
MPQRSAGSHRRGVVSGGAVGSGLVQQPWGEVHLDDVGGLLAHLADEPGACSVATRSGASSW